MFKRLFLVTVLALVLVLSNVAIAPAEAGGGGGNGSCASFYADVLVNGYGVFWSGPIELNEGEVLYMGATGDPGLQFVSVNGENSGTFPIGYYVTYTAPATGVYEVYHTISVSGEGTAKLWWRCGSFASGCENPYPSTAVVGTITDNAAVFGMPDASAMTNNVLIIGKTFWMDGLDSSGVYRRIWVGCSMGWVEAAKTGPNFDNVWNGTPLPTHTVD